MNHHQNFLYRSLILLVSMQMFITFLPAQDITLTFTPTCPGLNEGSIEATVVTEDYAPPFTFTWTDAAGNPIPTSQIVQDPAEGTSTVTGLAAGSYCLVVTSLDGCNASGCGLVVEELVGPVIDLNDIIVTCICAPTSPGTIDISLDPAGSPFEYEWHGPNGYISQDEDPDDIIKAGWYHLTVSNNNGCTASLPLQIHDCPPIEDMPPYIKKVYVKADLGGGNGPVIYQGEWVANGDCIAFEGESIPFSAVPVGQVGLKIYAVTNE